MLISEEDDDEIIRQISPEDVEEMEMLGEISPTYEAEDGTPDYKYTAKLPAALKRGQFSNFRNHNPYDRSFSGVFLPYPEAPPKEMSSWSEYSINSLLHGSIVGQRAVLEGQRLARYLHNKLVDREEWTKELFDIGSLKDTVFEPYSENFVGMDIGQAEFHKGQISSLLELERKWEETGVAPAIVGQLAAGIVDFAALMSLGVPRLIGGAATSFLTHTKLEKLSSKLLNAATKTLTQRAGNVGRSTATFLGAPTTKRVLATTPIWGGYWTIAGLQERELFAAKKGESLAAEVLVASTLGAGLELASPLFAKTVRSVFKRRDLHRIAKNELGLQREVGNEMQNEAQNAVPSASSATKITEKIRWKQAFEEEEIPKTVPELEMVYNELAQQLTQNPNDSILAVKANAAREMLIDRAPGFQHLKLFRTTENFAEPDYWNLGPATFDTITGKMYSSWKRFMNWSKLGGPAISLMEATAPTARAFLLKLNDTIYQVEGDLMGQVRPSNVRTMRELRLRTFYKEYTESMDSEYTKYLKQNPARSPDYLSQDNFYKLVGRMSPAKVPGNTNRFVKAAVIKNQAYYKMLTAEAQKRGLLPEVMGSLPNAEHYFPQVYDRSRLNSDASLRASLIAKVEQHFRETWPIRKRQELNELYADDAKKLSKETKKLESYLKSANYVRDRRVDAIEAIENATGLALGHSEPRIPALSAERSWVQARQITIPQELLAEYSDTHAIRVMQNFARSLIADVSLSDAFGTINLAESKLYKELQEFYSTAMAQASPEELLRLNKERENVINSIKILWSDARQFHGRSGSSSIDRLMDKTVSRISSYASTAYLGRVAFSMIPELFVKSLHVGIAPYTEGLFNFLKDKSVYGGHTKAELERFGIALTQAMRASSSHSFLEHQLTYTTGEKFDAFLKGAGKVQAKTSLYEFTDSFIRTTSAFSTMQEMKVALPKIAEGVADKRLTAVYSSLGIGKKEAKSILRMVEKHGEGINPNVGSWTDENARIRYLGALQSSINNALISGDVSLTPTALTRGPLKLLAIFSQWAFAANHRIVGAALQQGVARSFAPLMLIIGSGIASIKIKEAIRGSKPEQQATPGQLIAAGILYSGVTGVLGYGAERFANIIGGEIGESLTGRYIHEGVENTAVQLLGPTASLGDSVFAWAKAFFRSVGFTEEELSNRDFRRMYRIMPFQYNPFVYNFFSGRWPGIGAGDERVNKARLRRQLKYELKHTIPIVREALYEELSQSQLF